MALEYEVAVQGMPLMPPKDAEKGHCWASDLLPLPSLERWSAWDQGFVEVKDVGPQSKSVVGVVDDAAVAGYRCLSDG